LGNLLGPTVFGMVPDLIGGGAFTINPNTLLVQLTPGSGPPVEETYDMRGLTEAIVLSVILTAFFGWLGSRIG
jgi:hypothetical protein